MHRWWLLNCLQEPNKGCAVFDISYNLYVAGLNRNIWVESSCPLSNRVHQCTRAQNIIHWALFALETLSVQVVLILPCRRFTFKASGQQHWSTIRSIGETQACRHSSITLAPWWLSIATTPFFDLFCRLFVICCLGFDRLPSSSRWWLRSITGIIWSLNIWLSGIYENITAGDDVGSGLLLGVYSCPANITHPITIQILDLTMLMAFIQKILLVLWH